MNCFSLCVAACVVVSSAAFVLADPKPQTEPVLVELFTSEGCSSCPPADQFAAEIAKKSPVGGVPVIVLAYHVDYWDGLGWRDPFASKQWSDEQNAAVRALHGQSRYTPQMVVDGQADLVGSDWPRVIKAIDAASLPTKARLSVNASPASTGGVDVTVDVDPQNAWPAGQSVEIVVAVTEDNLTTKVRRGENAGKTLNHRDVVRALKVVGTIAVDDKKSVHVQIQAEPSWKKDQLHLVAFIRSSNDRHVHGATSISWPER